MALHFRNFTDQNTLKAKLLAYSLLSEKEIDRFNASDDDNQSEVREDGGKHELEEVSLATKEAWPSPEGAKAQQRL